MELQKGREAQREKIAEEILKIARGTLVMDLRFLRSAYFELSLLPTAEGRISTDGNFLFYQPNHIIFSYKGEQTSIARDYLHVILHLVFHHAFIGQQIDPLCWDLACDIIVEHAINELKFKSLSSFKQTAQEAQIAALRERVSPFTAEGLYRHYQNLGLTPLELTSLRELFFADDHDRWYTQPPEPDDSRTDGKNSRNAGGTGGKQQGPAASVGAQQTTEQKWQDISQRVKADRETLSKQHEENAGSFTQQLEEVTREKYDYREFLRRFCTMGEAIQINDDEFDYIFYTYGLKLYRNLPLIEPLEYTETHRIRDFVIAIDTSGSVEGPVVQQFVQKTFNILKQSDSFFTKINLHLIQCDAVIQEDVCITCQEELDHYLAAMQLHGFGGTDFRPVFTYVDELIANQTFTDLKGLLYFTDGYGTFPKYMPSYHTAFVFLDDEHKNPDVPVWAIKVVLDQFQITEANSSA